MQIPVLLDRSSREPLTGQIIDQLRRAIQQARIPAGTRLPSSRQLSEQLEVARNTVIRAYETLLIEGLVDARPASGVFVSTGVTTGPVRPAAPKNRSAEAPSWAMPIPSVPLRMPQRAGQGGNRLSFDFCPGHPHPALFPIKIWRRLLQRKLSHGGAAGLAEYGNPAGLPTLRAAIAAHIAATRGIVADPGRIVIVGGVQEGISIASRLFLHRGSLAAMEDPGFQGAALAFEATGSEIAAVGVDGEGLLPDELPKRPTALLYVTPSHQFPTGHVLAADRRDAIVAWARRCGCYILEDDSDGEFRFEGSPMQAIAAGAPDCTIYLGTFSRTLGAGLRLGFMVVPPRLAEATIAAKALLNSGNAWLDQAALAEMMQTNSYGVHLTRIRAHYRENRDCLLAALHRNFGEVSVTGETGGLHLLWYLPPGVPDAAVLEGLARRARIGIYPLGHGGAVTARPSALERRALMLGFGALLPRQIDQGIDRLSDVIDDAVDDLQADVTALLAEPLLTPKSAPRRPQRGSTHLDPRFRREPGLPKRRQPRAPSGRTQTNLADTPMARIETIYHYPIKGLSAQPLREVMVEAGKPFPQDRVFAFARPGAPLDLREPKWAKKGLFAMLMLDEGLAQVSTQLDPETLRLTACRGTRQVAAGCLDDAEDRAALERFFWTLLPKFPAPPVLLRSSSGHFMDKPDNVISLINLATVRSLEAKWGVAIDPLRFRANIYIDGAKPWEEFDWVGGDLRIGGTLFTVDRKNGRCGATNVDPATGRRDLDIPTSLRASFGHKNLGVYLIARQSGTLTIGDTVLPPGHAAPVVVPPIELPRAAAMQRRFICGGCYFIYEEALGLPEQGLPAGTSFDNVPADWPCPDCGTDKTVFRPHSDSAARLG